MSTVEPPARIPLLARLALFLVEKRLGRKLLAPRILSWYPRLFVGAGVLEGLAAHDEPEVPRRLLGLVRLHTSFLVSCPFCIDMNARDFQEARVSEEEIRGLQGRIPLSQVASLTDREKAALAFVQCMCRTPVAFPASVTQDMGRFFSPRATVIIAGTCAQVNFWARLIQALGVPPAGFTGEWPVLDLGSFATRK